MQNLTCFVSITQRYFASGSFSRAFVTKMYWTEKPIKYTVMFHVHSCAEIKCMEKAFRIRYHFFFEAIVLKKSFLCV